MSLHPRFAWTLLTALLCAPFVGAAEPKLELVVQTGSVYVDAVRFSMDGKRMLTGASGTAILWDVQTGQRLRTFAGPSVSPYHIALSGDGRRVLTQTATEPAVLWDAQTGQKLQTFAVELSSNVRCPLSADGRYLLAHSKGKIDLWDTQTGQKLRTFGDGDKEISYAVLSANGRRVLAWGKTVDLWDTQSGQKLQTLGDYVYDAVLSADGSRVLTWPSLTKTVLVWDAQTGQQIRTFNAEPVLPPALAIRADGQRALIQSGNSAIVWDIQTGQKLQTLFADGQFPKRLLVSADLGKFASLYDGRLVLSDVDSGKKMWTIERDDRGLYSADLSGTWDRLVAVSANKSAVLWNASTGTRIRTFVGHRDGVGCATVSGDGKRLATGSKDGTVIVWNAETGAKIRTVSAHSKSVWSVALSSDGKRLATGGADAMATLWNVETGEKLGTFIGHSSDVSSVSLSEDANRLATGSDDKTAILWNTETGKEVASFAEQKGAVGRVSLSGDATTLAINSFGTTLWNAGTTEKMRTLGGADSGYSGLRLFAQANRLFTVAPDGNGKIWDIKTGTELGSIIPVGDDLLVVTPDGYFDGPPNAAKFISYRIAGTLDFVPLENYRKQFERPGLLAKIMKGEDYRGVAALAQDLPPRVRIISPATKAEAKDGKFVIEAEAESRGQFPVQQFRLLVNGRPWSQKFGVIDIAEPKLGKATARREIKLEPGKHAVQVLAFTKAVFASSEGIELRHIGGAP